LATNGLKAEKNVVLGFGIYSLTHYLKLNFWREQKW